MIAKESRRVKTLSGFMKWVAQFNDGQYLFRGVSDEKYEIQASASRRLPKPDRNNPTKLLKINKEMISDARLEGHDQKNGQLLSDLELLAELQHYGAATCLIDFTHSAQVALWMACRQRSKWDVNGKVYAVRIDDPVLFKKVTSDSVQEKLDRFFKPDELGKYPLYQWQPKQQNNRIIAQQSVFLFGGAKIEAEAECVIFKSSKGIILDSLEKSSGITEARMFPDFDGFAWMRAHDRLYVEPNARNYIRRGIEAEQENRWDDAIAYYNEVILLQPVDDLTLAEAYCYRAYAYSSRGESDFAISDYTKATKLNPNFAYAYRNRGVTYEIDGKIDLAIRDFDKVIELNQESSHAYSDSARAYRKKGDINQAAENYRKAIELNPHNTNNSYLLIIIWLQEQNWENAKMDIIAAQNRGIDVINLFSQYHRTLEELEDGIEVKLPNEIAAMLMKN